MTASFVQNQRERERERDWIENGEPSFRKWCVLLLLINFSRSQTTGATYQVKVRGWKRNEKVVMVKVIKDQGMTKREQKRKTHKHTNPGADTKKHTGKDKDTQTETQITALCLCVSVFCRRATNKWRGNDIKSHSRDLSPRTHTDEKTGENKSTGEESKKWQTPKHKAAHTVRIFRFFSRISSLNSVVSFRAHCHRHRRLPTDNWAPAAARLAPLSKRGERNRIRLRESAAAKRKRREKEGSPAAYSHCLLLPNCFQLQLQFLN